MIPRRLRAEVEAGLRRQAAVCLLGPRQAGKTTLALEVAADRDSVYLDLESPSDRSRLSEPESYLRAYEEKLVIIDEVQRMPDLFEVLRGVIDAGRRSGAGMGRFLLLGSASPALLRQSGESLAGRITYLELQPFDPTEVDDPDRLWLRGGFPPSYLARDERDSLAWREDFIRTYLERDIPQLGPRLPAETLRRFWTMLAHSQGSLLNAARLAAGLGVSGVTVARYLDLLVDLLLVRRLPPWTANVGKRLVKSPKTYVRDTGIVHALLGIESFDALLGNPIVGPSWEGHAIESLLGVVGDRAIGSFFRTSAGAEIDLVLTWPGSERWAIEIKRSLSPSLTRGFHHARETLEPTRTFVVYPGEERYKIEGSAEVIGLRSLAEMIADDSFTS